MPDFIHPVTRKDEKPKLALLGIGSAGINSVCRIASNISTEPKVIIIDQENTKTNSAIHSVSLQTDNRSEESIQREVIAELNNICTLLEGFNHIVIFSGLGAQGTSFITPTLVKGLKKTGRTVWVIGYFPFKFEGKPREKNALTSIRGIEGVCDFFLVLKNDWLTHNSNHDGDLSSAYEFFTDTIANAINFDDIAKPLKILNTLPIEMQFRQ